MKQLRGEGGTAADATPVTFSRRKNKPGVTGSGTGFDPVQGQGRRVPLAAPLGSTPGQHQQRGVAAGRARYRHQARQAVPFPLPGVNPGTQAWTQGEPSRPGFAVRQLRMETSAPQHHANTAASLAAHPTCMLRTVPCRRKLPVGEALGSVPGQHVATVHGWQPP